MGKAKRNSIDINEFIEYYEIHTNKETAERFGLNCKDYDILKGQCPKRTTAFWVTNGSTEKQVHHFKAIPTGFKRGRLSMYGEANHSYGTIAITDGTVTKFHKKDLPIPDGFIVGSNFKSTKGYRTYNDGTSNFVYGTNDVVPSNMKPGRVDNSNYKKAAARRKAEREASRIVYYKYNDGEYNYKNTTGVPAGYTEGWLSSRQIRDAEYDRMGYVPISKYPHLGCAYSYMRLIVDRVVLPGPYVYVSKESLKDLEEYAKTNHSKGVSFSEQKLAKAIKEICPYKIITNTKKVITPQELDIYIPDLKIAIEYNGTYWHNVDIVGKYYHLNKSLRCRQLGVRLIHIHQFEDIDVQLFYLKCLFNDGIDKFDTRDFNKNNLIEVVPVEPSIVYSDKYHTIYGAGMLY